MKFLFVRMPGSPASTAVPQLMSVLAEIPDLSVELFNPHQVFTMLKHDGTLPNLTHQVEKLTVDDSVDGDPADKTLSLKATSQIVGMFAGLLQGSLIVEGFIYSPEHLDIFKEAIGGEKVIIIFEDTAVPEDHMSPSYPPYADLRIACVRMGMTFLASDLDILLTMIKMDSRLVTRNKQAAEFAN